MAGDLTDVLIGKRILVCVGSGGVGKTTTAAALALEAARRGRKTLVLTIDPARRLANSLGLEELGHDVRQVPPARLHDVAPGGALYAMMLDQKRAFDEVVQEYASNPESIRRIMANPVYAQISGSLAGSQEYAALAKLQRFDAEGGYDLIVVDTPPTAHALDFLDAPEKLTRAIDSPAIDWFRKVRGQEPSRWSLVGQTGAYMLKRLSKFVGSRFLDDLAVFFTEFSDILAGFRERAEQTYALLRQDRVGFILVASPEAMAIREALFFHERLKSSSMPFAAFVVNRVHQRRPIPPGSPPLAELLAATPAVAALGLAPTTLRTAAEAIETTHAEFERLAEADALSLDRLRAAGGPAARLIAVPFFEQDIFSVERLAELGRYFAAGN